MKKMFMKILPGPGPGPSPGPPTLSFPHLLDCLT